MKSIRCAIYTRKSSEEGLEQDFNSLDAQHAACSAYIASQASEGWTLLNTRYDDGGISGGTLERPGLKKLLSDIASGQVDIVVVYKVDRLTRSLLDFSKLVEAFDGAGVSFVSVTQSFNTTTSMGRLTLNMLLSFAQFEREVTAERIRDKIAASKQRGMWMGGTPPIGYKPDGRSLAIIDTDADLVRSIFQRYLELGTVRRLHDQLVRDGTHQPVRTTMDGRTFGGTPFQRGQLYNMLKNPLYTGHIRHGAKTYPGNHKAIIDMELWEKVQAQLNDNTQGEQLGPTVKDPSLLVGKVVDQQGRPLVATHANKGKVRYRYYVSRHLQHGIAKGDGDKRLDGLRIPARELEQVVLQAIVGQMKDPIGVARQLGASTADPKHMATIVSRSAALLAKLDGKRGLPVQVLLGRLVRRVAVQEDAVELTFEPTALGKELGLPAEAVASAEMAIIIIPARIRRSGLAVRFILDNGQRAAPGPVDDKFLAAIAQGRSWWQRLTADSNLTVTDLARAEGLSPPYLDRILRLSFLAPDIVEALLDGSAPAALNLESTKDLKRIAPSWSDQRRLMGFAEQRG
jgi:DNA invertase Pin-like site-specific DNA recombinase